MLRRQLDALIPHALDKVEALDTWLDILAAEIRRMEEANPDDAEYGSQNARHSKEALQALLRDLHKLIDINERLMAQYETADKAFYLGWNSRYNDMVAKLSSEEFLHLRMALGVKLDIEPVRPEKKADAEDSEDKEVPF